MARFWHPYKATRPGRKSCNLANTLTSSRDRWNSTRGFTLIEMMIVVVIVGVLGTLATYGMLKYMRAARTSEALAMMIDIKAAEEVVRDETYAYLGLEDFTAWHPVDPPGNFATDWGRDNGEATDVIRQLAVVSSGPAYFTYTVVAGLAADSVPAMPCGHDLHFPSPAGAPFYVVVAKGDMDGDHTNSYVIGHSYGSDLHIDDEGE